MPKVKIAQQFLNFTNFVRIMFYFSNRIIFNRLIYVKIKAKK